MYKVSISNPLLCSALATADSKSFFKFLEDAFLLKLSMSKASDTYLPLI